MALTLSLADRVAAYNGSTFGLKYPDSRLHLSASGSSFAGVWFLGNDYRNKTPYYGAYPPRYLDRVNALFPEPDLDVLHLFAGSVTPGRYTRLDLNPALSPDVVGSAEKLSTLFPPDSFDLVFADPPYSKADAERYATPMPNRKKVLEQIHEVIRPGGYVVWLDTVWPQISKSRLRLVGFISIVRSQNHRLRGTCVFQRPF